MLPADSEHVSVLSTPAHSSSLLLGHATTHVLFAQTIATAALPPMLLSHWLSALDRHGLPGKLPVGKHAFSCAGMLPESKQV